MPVDFDESRMLGELQDLEEEIELLDEIQSITVKRDMAIKRLRSRLEDMKYHQEMRLKIHRQKVKESGVKF